MTPQPVSSARRLPSWLRTGLALSALAVLAVSSAAGPSLAQQLFDEALETLSANYFGYARLDAPALRSSFGARLERECAGQGEACPYSVAAGVVTEMAASLGDPHTYRVTPEVARARELEFAGRPLQTPALGLTVAPLPDAPALLVKRVLENSPAARAGLARGDTLWSLNGAALERLGSAEAAAGALKAAEATGNTVRLEVRRVGLPARQVTAQPEVLPVWLPQLEVRPDGVAVLTFFHFKSGNQVADRVHALVRRAQEVGARAMVLDVRDSAGGLVSECVSATAAFLEKPAVLDDFKEGRYRFEFAGGRFASVGPGGRRSESRPVRAPALWTGPLVVLTNAVAKSAPEYLAYMLQRAGRARVVGEPTLGALGTSNSLFSLADGSGLAVSMGRSLEPDGTPYPERVTPDTAVSDDPAALGAGRDRPMEAALALLGPAR